MCFFILCGETGIRPPPFFLRDGDSYVAPLLTIHSLPGGHPVQSFEHVCPLKRAWTFKPCQSLAERRGFEPRKPFWSLHAFQACLFNHSSISPSRFQAQNSISATKLLLFSHIRKSLCKFLHIFCYFMPKSCRALALVASIISSTDTFKTCASRSATSAMKRLSFRSPL